MIHAPHALPLFREPRPGGKRKREKERADPVKSQMPDRGGAAPLKPGTGGQIGATGGTLLTQYVLKHQARAPGSCSVAHVPSAGSHAVGCQRHAAHAARAQEAGARRASLLAVMPDANVIPAHLGAACLLQAVPALAQCLAWQASGQFGSCK